MAPTSNRATVMPRGRRWYRAPKPVPLELTDRMLVKLFQELRIRRVVPGQAPSPPAASVHQERASLAGQQRRRDDRPACSHGPKEQPDSSNESFPFEHDIDFSARFKDVYSKLGTTGEKSQYIYEQIVEVLERAACLLGGRSRSEIEGKINELKNFVRNMTAGRAGNELLLSSSSEESDDE